MKSKSAKIKRHVRFTPKVEDLLNYCCPEWFRDAKFGIYVHWGVYSVAEQGEWYPRHLYMQGHPQYAHHVKTYGHPSQFGYKDFIPLWHAEHFDPDRLVALFKRAGARYFTPCAVHHDNFDLWNSRHQRWNSVKMGPHKDIIGLWRAAALKQGLRFGVTTHLERTYSWFNTSKGSDRRGPLKGVPYDGNDPACRDFYLEPHGDTELRHPHNAPSSWREHWFARIKDLIDQHHPEHLYFDGALPFLGDDRARTGLKLLAYYYNDSIRRNGQQECVMCIKMHKDHGYYFDGVATLDMEVSKSDAILLDPWQTDTSIGPWGYVAGCKYRTVQSIVHELVDIVSKNGNMLLNVPPKADGTLDRETEAILEGIGRWMDVNGEAIYATRPWRIFGEGDVRFTRKGNTLYAIALARPARTKTLTIAALGTDEDAGRVADVSLLGGRGRLKWTQDAAGLHIKLPAAWPCEHAWSFRLRMSGGLAS
jgi:alpha-L-fucosidase